MTCRRGHAPKHPDFEPGNVLSLKHGAYSPTVIAEEAARVHAALLEECPWLDEPRYMPSLMRYLAAAGREQLAHKALVNAAKFSPRLLESCTAAARLVWQMGDELGLTPAGHARLKVLVVDAVSAEQSLADLVERGRQIREARQAEFGNESHQDGPQSNEADEDGQLVVLGEWDAAGADEAGDQEEEVL